MLIFGVKFVQPLDCLYFNFIEAAADAGIFIMRPDRRA